MAKKIAIIIGISDYVNVPSLNGCKVDADSIRTILDATGKYDEILQMDGKVDSSELDQRLPEFISKYKSETIDEVLFYYSGHGCLLNDSFAYVASDFDSSIPNSTTLNNDTVDDLLKSLNANLVVKVIDACKSGTQYVKDIELTHKYINQHKDEFTNCYFMFSSRNDQYSMATPSLSIFTRSFIQAVKNCPIGEIKYASIAKRIADDFIKNPDQKPQFVNQAELTEVFCNKDNELDCIIDNILKDGKTTHDTKPVGTDSPLLMAIKEDSRNYRSEEQIYEILEKAKEGISAINHRKDITDLFDFSITFTEKHSGFTKDNEIGEWLSKKKHNYFAKTERTRYHQLDRLISSGNTIGLIGRQELQTVNGLDPLLYFDNSYISGFSSLIDYPFEQVICLFKPKYTNLSAFKVQIAFVCSTTELVLFSYSREIQNVKDMNGFLEVTPLSVKKIKYVDGDISAKFIEKILEEEDAIIAKLNNQFLNAPDSSIG